MSDKKFVLKLRNSPGRRRNILRDSPVENKDNDQSRKSSKFILPIKRKLLMSPSPAAEEKLKDSPVAKFRNDLTGEFPYPPYGKYLAWYLYIFFTVFEIKNVTFRALSCIVILGANAVISYKGMLMDGVEGSLWLGISVLTLVLLFFIFQPILIGFYAIAIKYVYDVSEFVSSYVFYHVFSVSS